MGSNLYNEGAAFGDEALQAAGSARQGRRPLEIETNYCGTILAAQPPPGASLIFILVVRSTWDFTIL